MAVAPQAGDQENARVINDGSGGAIVVWQDFRAAGKSRLYAQRFNAEGIAQWTQGGVAVADSQIWNQVDPKLHPDGSGGVIVVWTHQDTSLGADVYAQKIDGTGSRAWGDSGVIVSDANRGQLGHSVTQDGCRRRYHCLARSKGRPRQPADLCAAYQQCRSASLDRRRRTRLRCTGPAKQPVHSPPLHG